jgi:hypothetical protein
VDDSKARRRKISGFYFRDIWAWRLVDKVPGKRRRLSPIVALEPVAGGAARDPAAFHRR